MPLKRESFLVPYCPSCKEKIYLTGHPQYQKKREVVQLLQLVDGDTFEEKLAASCSEDCLVEFWRRRKAK